MTTIIIEDSCVQARRFIEYALTLPFATIMRTKAEKKKFHEASEECNAVSVKTFTDELRRQIDEHFDKYA